MELKINLIPDGVDDEGQPLFTSIEDAIVDDIRDKIISGVNKSIERITSEQVMKAAVAYSETKVKEIIDGLIDKPLAQTNQYGEHKGATITITELIIKKVNKYLGSSVNSYGQPSYDGKSPIHQIIEKIATDVLTKQVVEQTKEIRSKLILQIAEKLAK